MTIEPTSTGRDVGSHLTGRDLTGWWIVGVDGSECSANAAAWAAAHAPGRARGLQIVTAWEAPTVRGVPDVDPVGGQHRRHRDAGGSTTQHR